MSQFRSSLRAVAVVTLVVPALALGALCVVVALLPLTPTRVGVRNLRERLGAGPLRARAILAGVYFQYVCYFAEILVAWPLGLVDHVDTDRLTASLRDLKARHRLSERQGVMCLGAHFGNIEALGLALKEAYAGAELKPFYVLAKPAKTAFVERIFSRMRQGRGFHVLSTRGPRFKEELREAAASGFGLALLTDQKPRVGGTFVPFFGAEAAFPEKGVALGLEEGMALIYVTHRRVGFGRFELLFRAAPNAHLDGWRAGAGPASDDQVTATLAGYAAWLEECIRATPWLWSWDYRKWSRRKGVDGVAVPFVAASPSVPGMDLPALSAPSSDALSVGTTTSAPMHAS